MAERKQARNIYFDTFADFYQRHYQMPYAPITADWVGLDGITNKGPLAPRMTLEVFTRGCVNYFASEIGAHTLRHLCSQFVPYWRQPLDRYGKPKEKASQVGRGEATRGWQFQPGIVKKFCEEADRLAMRDKHSFDAIHMLFDEVADTDMDEVTAFKRLREIERGTD